MGCCTYPKYLDKGVLISSADPNQLVLKVALENKLV